MNCKHCGEKLAVFSRYCENCGQEAYSFLGWLKIIGTPIFLFFKKRLWLAIILAFVLVAGIVFAIIFGGPKYIDPTDYILTHTEGFNGSGEILASIDYDSLCEDLLGKAPDTSTKKGYEKNAEYQLKIQAIKSSLSTTIDRSTNLSNGDFYIVTIHVYNDEIYEELGYSLKLSEYKKTLQIGKDSPTFEDPITKDIFDFVTVGFEGSNGYGSLSILDSVYETSVMFSSGRELSISVRCSSNWSGYTILIVFPEYNDSAYLELHADKSYNLNNGDTVKLTLNTINSDELRNYGIIVENYEKTFTVSGLN